MERMAPLNIETQYKELLCPIKNIEQSMFINVAGLLKDYLSKLMLGKAVPNFNSAALLLQGSCNIYAKKVEYLHNLATQLHQYLTKSKKDDQGKKDNNVKPTKEPKKKIRNRRDIGPGDLKPGRNLSILLKKNAVVPKKSSRKKCAKKPRNMPAHLMPTKDDGKVVVLYDVRGVSIGNEGDYLLFRCKFTASGWLLLPNVCSSLITFASDNEDDNSLVEDELPSLDLPEDYFPANALPNSSQNDEVLETEPSISEMNSQIIPTLVEINQPHASQEVSTDLAIDVNCPVDDLSIDASCPVDDLAIDASCPVDDLAIDASCPVDDDDDDDDPNLPITVETTDELQATLEVDGDNDSRLPLKDLSTEANEKTKKKRRKKLYIKTVIEKGNTVSLPKSMRSNGKEQKVELISSFCARAFFTPQTKVSRRDRLLFESVFHNNSQLFNEMVLRIKHFREDTGQRVHPNEDYELNVDDTDDTEDLSFNVNSDSGDEGEGKENELLRKPLTDDDIPINIEGLNITGNDGEGKENELLRSSLTDDDFSINIEELHNTDAQPPEDEVALSLEDEVALPPEDGVALPLSESPIVEVPRAEALMSFTDQYIANCAKEMEFYALQSDTARNVHEWEKEVRPALEEMEKREHFDIDHYGSRILNAFEDNNRKQTITFKEFCKGKEKWEIQRYFLALLPLVNMGNVSIENIRSEDGTDDQILITLRSRKMHHTELEEFGHSSGEHLE